MRAPKPKGHPVSLARKRGWVQRFGAYRHAIDIPSVNTWLHQFEDADLDLAARVLDCVDFVGAQGIAASFRTGLNSLGGWHADPTKRVGKWRFCPWSTSAGESGDSMLHNFRIANNLSAKTKAVKELFIQPAEIVMSRLGSEDSLVFVNDFVGSGSEVCEAWENYFSELAAGVGNVYLLVSVSCSSGRKRIAEETDVKVVFGQELTEVDNLFDAKCKHFDKTDKDALMSYAAKADKKQPKGYGDCGLLLVFQHRCPNNTVPFLHATSKKWDPLFPRHD